VTGSCFGFSCLTSALLLFVATAAGGDLTVDEIIARNTAAMGGAAAIEAVHAVEVTLHISNPDFEVDGVYRAARPGRMRIDITAGGKHVFTEAFDGERAWQWQEGKPQKEAGATPTAALRHGVELPGNLFGLHEMRSRGHRLELKGRERINETEYYVLGVTLADGYETSLYIDPITWRITRRRDVRALHPDIDPTPTTIEVRKSDWREIDGVWFAFAGEDVDVQTGKVLERTTVKSIRVNPQIDPAIFTKL
jgi:hypothetical protein